MPNSYRDIADSVGLLGYWSANDLYEESDYVRCTCTDAAGAINEMRERLSAYDDAEEQGLLVRLPCKVGDTLYEIDLPEYGVIVCNVLCFTYGRSNITGELTWCVAVNVVGGHGLGSCYTFNPDDFGTTVFLTRGAAEAALKGESKDV